MEWYHILLIVIACILGLFLFIIVPLVILPLYIAKRVYTVYLVREPKEKWGRECSDTTNEEQVIMYNEGIKWAKDKDFKKETIVSEGFKLVGEYLDNNSDTCVIVIPGRTESLLYSYYFSMPYYKNGYNILVIDNRSHGLSEGYYDTIGIEEYKDILKWIELLQTKYHIKKVILHGICIGAATACFAKAHDKTGIISCIISDGLFTNFYEIFKNHMIADGHPAFPVCKEVMYFLKKYTKADIYEECPLKYLPNMDIPMLFLYSDQDKYVLNDMKEKVFNTCGSKDKLRVDFKKGAHSHLRINQQIEYDNAIIEFLKTYNL